MDPDGVYNDLGPVGSSRRKFVFFLGFLAVGCFAQDTPPENPDNFSGTVISVSDNKITVNRRSWTRDTVTKTFIIEASTKIEGKIKPKVRVTVRFVVEENEARAIHIIVR